MNSEYWQLNWFELALLVRFFPFCDLLELVDQLGQCRLASSIAYRDLECRFDLAHGGTRRKFSLNGLRQRVEKALAISRHSYNNHGG